MRPPWASNWNWSLPWSPSASSLEHRQQTPQCRILQPEHCLDQNQKPMQTNLKLLDIIGSNAMLLQGPHQQWPKLLLLFSLRSQGYAQFADGKDLQIKMQMIFSAFKRFNLHLYPPSHLLSLLHRSCHPLLCKLIWNRQSLNSTL